MQQFQNFINFLLADLCGPQQVILSFDFDNFNLLIELDTSSPLVFELLRFFVQVRQTQVGRKEAFSTMIRAFPPICITVVYDYHNFSRFESKFGV
jgi:hypothetical protein